MFGWLLRKRAVQAPVVRPPFHDPKLGRIEWDGDRTVWFTHVEARSTRFRIEIAGDACPDPRLLAHARDFAEAPEELLAQVARLLDQATAEIPEAADEIAGLEVESVCLCRPDCPDDGMIYLDGPGTDERVWRCDYVGRRARDLGFDD